MRQPKKRSSISAREAEVTHRRLRCAAGQRVPGKFSRAHFTVGVLFDDREELMLLITLISAEKNFDDSVCD